MTSVQPLSSLQRSSRKIVLDELGNLIETSEAKLEEVLLKIGWTRESLKETEKVTCPVDSGHSVPEGALTRHVDRCQWAREGYSKEEYVNTPSSAFFYQNTNTVFSLKLDQDKQSEILTSVSGGPTPKPVPRTPARARSNFTQAERLALYDHVVADSQKSRRSSLSVKVLNEIGEDAGVVGSSSMNVIVKSEASQQTRLEELKLMRDYKRRRQSYRAKNVHITKRSQTEIMREIIANQMEDLETEPGQASPSIEGERRASSVIEGDGRSGLKREGHGETDSRSASSLVDDPRLHPTYPKKYHREANNTDQRSRDSNTEDGELQNEEEQESGMSKGSRLNHNHHEEIGNNDMKARPSTSREGSASPERVPSLGEGFVRESDEYNGEQGRKRSRSRSAKRSRHKHKHSKKHKKHKKGSR